MEVLKRLISHTIVQSHIRYIKLLLDAIGVKPRNDDIQDILHVSKLLLRASTFTGATF